MVAREHKGRPGRRRVNETKRLATDEPATRLVSARVSEEYSVRPSAKSARRAGETRPFIEVGKADVGGNSRRPPRIRN